MAKKKAAKQDTTTITGEAIGQMAEMGRVPSRRREPLTGCRKGRC